MALPTLADKIDAVEDKLEKENIISEIASAVFRSAKISTEAVAKFAVAPSVPQMVDEVLEDLKSGSIQKFNQAMDKLDKLVRTLGIDLKKYNKELANFAEKREEKIIKSEEKIQTLREKNIVAQIEKSGDITILSQKEIEKKQDELKKTEKRISDLEKKIAKDTKQVQDPGLFDKKLRTTAQFNKKQEIIKDTEELEQAKKERDQAKQVLGDRGEEPSGIIQNVRGGMDTVADYLPDQLVEIGSAFKEGLMAPFTAIQELGQQFGQLLKPLKLLRPLFKGIIGSLKKFALGLKASVVAFLPYLAIAALVVLALGALFLILKKFKDKFGSEKDNKFDMGPQETDVLDEDAPVAAENNFGSRMQRKTFVIGGFGTGKEAEFIKPDDPRYDELYEQKFGKPAPKEGQVYMGDGKSAILPLSSDGRVNPFEMRNKPPVLFDNPLKDLAPVEKTETGGSAQVNNVVQNSNTNNSTVAATGAGSPQNNDYQAFLYRESVSA